jgi:hypothetical protein
MSPEWTKRRNAVLTKKLQQWKVQSSTSQESYLVYSFLHSLLLANVGREIILHRLTDES